jgi:MreB/Mbl protein
VDQAMLKNLDRRIRDETELPVSIADNPLCCVMLGTGKILDDLSPRKDSPLSPWRPEQGRATLHCHQLNFTAPADHGSVKM